MMAASDDDDEYEIPLRDQRYFGAGLKRKRVHFVASTEQAQLSTSLPTTPRPSLAAERYLSIVLGQSNTAERAASAPAPAPEQSEAVMRNGKMKSGDANQETILGDDTTVADNNILYCDLCRRSITAGTSKTAHERTMAHQMSLEHSHPPSHVDRSRKGLAVLRDHGWDPDSRLGLGAQGQGRLQPVKAVENPQKAGVGARLAPAKLKEKPAKLDAGKVRQMELDNKKKAEKLRKSFYMSDDVQKYLGEM